jgi:hypothetical protein
MPCWVEGLWEPEALVVLTGPCLVGSGDGTLITLLGCRSAATWWVAVVWFPWTQSYVPIRQLHPSSQPCWEFLPANPYLANWSGWGYHRVLMQFVLGQCPPVQCPPNSSLGPGFPLSPSDSREAWAKLYVLSPGCNASSAGNKSLNLHGSHTLPDYWKCESLVHVVASEWRGHCALPDLTLLFPQVVSRIWFYNGMLINLYPDFKRITLGGKPQK